MSSVEEDLKALSYPTTEDQAIAFHAKTRSQDPFPHIEPSLLNRVDIARYASATAMIFPFDPVNLKSASYEAQVGEEVLYWSYCQMWCTRADQAAILRGA